MASTGTAPMATVDMAARAVPGLRLRPYAGEGDLPEIVRIVNRALEADGVPERRTVDQLAARWGKTDTFDARREIIVAEVDGEKVGYGRTGWVDTTDGVREYLCLGQVDPEWRRQGIGTALHAWNEAHLRELAATHDTALPRVFGSLSLADEPGSTALLERSGYRPLRWSFDMRRPTLDDIPDVGLPEGIEVRPVSSDDARAIWDADTEAFRDHPGGFDASDAAFRNWVEGPEFQPDLFVVAWDGNDVAGAVLNTIDEEENRLLGVRQGVLDSVFTRRPWRRRGLARALIARSLRLLRERGMTSAVLGVDADNPSGALGLYESFGFRVQARFVGWRKPFEETDR